MITKYSDIISDFEKSKTYNHSKTEEFVLSKINSIIEVKNDVDKFKERMKLINIFLMSKNYFREENRQALVDSGE